MHEKPKTKPVEVITVLSPRKLIVRFTLDTLGEALSALEQKILRSYRRKQGRNLNLGNAALEIDAHVLVISEDFEGARRGLIIDIDRGEEPLQYGVFLYDYGLFRIYERSSMERLKSVYQNELAPCARYVTMPGLVPSTYIPGLCVPAQEWSDESIKFVEDWIQEKPTHLLQLAPIDDVSICGDFYQEGGKKSLSTSLTEEKLAIYDKNDFIKLMGTREDPSQLDSTNEKDGKVSGDTAIPVSGIKSKFARLRVGDCEGDEASPDENGDDINETTIATLPVKVLLRGTNLLPPYNQLESFPLQRFVAKTLQCDMKILQINHLQRSSWPHVLRGRNCFIIGGQSKRKGKSLSYIVPIAANCLSELEASNKTSQNTSKGPLGLFICSSMHSGEKLKEHMDKLLGRSKIAIYLAMAATADLKYRLRENPEFIITTPDFVHVLVHDYYASFGFDRLRYLVFDDAHVLMKYKLEPMTSLIQKLSHYLEKIVTRPYSLQTIFCGQEWNQEMEAAFLNVTVEPVLIMGSSFQAVAYGGVKVHVHFVKADEKADRLAELVEDKIQTRTVIVCQTQETVVHIGHNLYRNKGIKTAYLPPGDATSDQLNELRNQWLNSLPEDRLMFICVDSDLRELKLEDAGTVIHYDMPSAKLETFGDRHVCMWNFFPDISKGQDESDESVPLPETELTSHVFLTPDEPDLHKIVRHLRKFKVQIPQSLNILTEIACNEEEKKARLCESIMQFGKCDRGDKQDCDRRHFLNKDELEGSGESTVPRVGRVEIEITQCVTVNTFKGKLQHYYKVINGRKSDHISFLNILKKREEYLTQYYSSETNRVPLPNPRKKAICGFQSNEGSNYTRGMIETVLKTSDLGFPLEVRVFCIDTGHYAVRAVTDLYTLPEEFVSAQPTCVNVILADLKPVNAEEQFKLPDNMKARKLTEGRIYTARIVFSIGNTIWVKPMAEYERDRSGDLVQRKNVRIELTRELRVAEDNPNHLIRLYQMAELVGFDCDIYRTSEVIGRDFEDSYYHSPDPISWAHLRTYSIHEPKTDLVWSTYVKSPDFLFVTLDKFVNFLDDLNKELEEHVLTQIEGKYADYASKFLDYYEERMCVAAKERSEKVWNRAIITKIREDVEGKKLFDVFFVDHGDSEVGMSGFELFPIPKKFVNRLPFQCIALKINHVCRDEGVPEWNEKVRKALYDLLFTEDDKSKSLDIMAVEKLRKLNGNEPPCEYYEAFVFVEDKELGEFLVEKNYAKYCTGMEDYLNRLKKKMLDQLNKLVDSQLKIADNDDDDNDDDEVGEAAPGLPNMDDFDIYLGGDGAEGFVNTFFPNMTKKNGAAALPGLFVDEPMPSSSKSLRAELAANSTAGNSASTSCSAGTSNAPTNPIKTGNHALPTKKPTVAPAKNLVKKNKPTKEDLSGAESTEYTKKPQVTWTQTKTAVTLRIGIPDLKKYTFKVGDDKRCISFQSEDTPPNNYSFELELFGKVLINPEFTPLGQCLVVKLTKLTPDFKWTTVTREKINCWWLKRDLNSIDSDDSDDYSDDDDEIGEGFGIPTPQSVKESHEFETPLSEKRTYENMPFDFERDDEDSFSSDSDISDDAGRDADLYRTRN